MIDNIAVGPPMTGFPGNELREAARSPREDGSGSFSRTLGDKIDPKVPKAALERRERPTENAVKEREDSPPRRLEPEAAKGPGMKRAEGAREKAIRKFMDSFESEFGIPPTRIVEAMASIEPQKMNEAPEATVQDVVESLDLAPEERERAMAMYAGLLAQLQVIDRATPAPAKTEAFTALPMTTPHVQERFEAAHVQRLNLNRSLDQMNEKFWMKDRASAMDVQNPFLHGSAMPALDRFQVDEAGMDAIEERPVSAEIAPELRALLEGEEGMPRDTVAPEDAPLEDVRPANQPEPARMKQVLTEMKRAADEAKRAEIQAKLESSGLTAAPVAAPVAASVAKAPAASSPALAGSETAPSAATSATQGLPVLSKNVGGEGGNGQSAFGNSKGQSEGRSESGSSSGSGGEFRMAQAAATPAPLKLEDVAAALKTAPPLAGAAALTMTPADNEANVRQLMNQAQYLIKKGGGEVKVVMNPEGLGPVQLKVLVQDGKVNVQMATESSEAKKAIESSLPELRSSLAAHKLSVDHVKVDFVAGPNTENQARNETNSNLNQQQRDTRQFWNQFQENFGNRGQREGFMELPAMKEYRRTSAPTPLEPAKIETASVRAPSKEKGRGLNLVA